MDTHTHTQSFPHAFTFTEALIRVLEGVKTCLPESTLLSSVDGEPV